MARIALLVVLFLWAVPAGAGEETGPTVADLAFIAGSWQGSLFGGHAEETWLPPHEGTMVGVFRLSWPDSENRVYEMFLVEETGDGEVVMTFRHFSSLLEMREQEIARPLGFRLVETAPRRAVFAAPDPAQEPARMVFAGSASGDSLTVTVQSLDTAGDVGEAFDAVYTRVP